MMINTNDITTIIKPVKVGDEFDTVAGYFKIIGIDWSNKDDDYEATCIWTIYDNYGKVYDVTKCIILFGDLADYIKYNYTDDVRVKLIYERS